jgi:PAS domain S-box-containing protein
MKVTEVAVDWELPGRLSDRGFEAMMSDATTISEAARDDDWALGEGGEPDLARVVAGQKQALELAVHGASLEAVLGVLTRTAESQSGRDTIASIMLLDPDGRSLRVGAAPTLPAPVAAALDGVAVGPDAFCAGIAAHTADRVVVQDLSGGPGPERLRELTTAHGLRSSWSAPILSSQRRVLGTLTLYYGSNREPTAADDTRLQLLIDTAAVVIERHREAGERVAAVNALRENERRYRELIMALPAAVYTTDDRGRITLFNEAAVNLWGREPAAEENWSVVYKVARPDGTPVPVEQNPVAPIVGESGTVAGVEAIVERSDGVRKNVLVYPELTRNASGSIAGGINIILDITDRKLAEEALSRSEAFARGVVANSPDCVNILDLDARLVWMSEQGLRLMEIADFELLRGVPWLEFWSIAKDRRAAEAALELGKAGGVGRFEGYCPNGLGEAKWWDVAISAIPGPDGRPERLLAVSRDITDRRLAQEALRESEERFRNMADNAPVMVWVSDRDGVFTFLSKSWSEFTGQSAPEGLGRGWTAAIEEADRERVIETFEACNREGKGFGFEFRIVRHDGVPRWAMVAAVPRRSPDGRFLGFTGSIIDITERKQAEDALRLADRRKDEFLATLAHELRNPLAPIRNGLQIMRLAQGSGEPFARTQAMMERQLEQMVRLIDDLLDLSRISRGKVELHRTRVDIGTVLQSALETSRPVIEQFEHRLAVEFPSVPVLVDADVTRLAQVFANLLNNAAKYTPRGGRIMVMVEPGDGEVEIKIRDTGVGIPPDMRARVFEMFTQVDRSLERTQGGLGIGLSISKQLVEMHGGVISVESDGVGLGSEFVVRLPTASAEGHVTPAIRRERPSGGRGAARRILVADDNDDSVWSLATMLRMMGHEVRTATDGLRAVMEAAEFQPDVIFLDIGMPNLNGYDACRRIRQETWGKSAAVVAVTGWGQDEDIARSMAAGFDSHLVKPVGFDALRALLAAPAG